MRCRGDQGRSALLMLGVALTWHPAWGKGLSFNRIPPQFRPRWEPFPNIPEILYSRVLEQDVFRCQGNYYLFWRDQVYRAGKPAGPWQQLKRSPAIFYRLRPQDFKSWWKQKEALQFWGPPGPSPFQ